MGTGATLRPRRSGTRWNGSNALATCAGANELCSLPSEAASSAILQSGAYSAWIKRSAACQSSHWSQISEEMSMRAPSLKIHEHCLYQVARMYRSSELVAPATFCSAMSYAYTQALVWATWPFGTCCTAQASAASRFYQHLAIRQAHETEVIRSSIDRMITSAARVRAWVT